MADVIILSTADWDHPLWTNKQHTALALAAAGHRVLYVESLGLRAPRAGRRDLKRIARRLLRMLRLPRLVAPRVWVWSPPVWPGGQMGWPLALNRHLLRRVLLNFSRRLCWILQALSWFRPSPPSTMQHQLDSLPFLLRTWPLRWLFSLLR